MEITYEEKGEVKNMGINLKLVEESYKYRLGEKVDFEHTTISLVSARRDWIAFQVICSSDEAVTLSAGRSTVFSPVVYQPIFGEVINIANIRLQAVLDGFSADNIRMFPIGLADDDDGVHKADILLHSETVFVKARSIQTVWVEVSIPEDVKPAAYYGEIQVYSHTLFEDEKLMETLPFYFTVKDVLLPEPENFRFHLDLWQHLSNIARKHETKLWSDEHFKVLEGYVESLGKLGQKAVTIIASEDPWSGQACFKWAEYTSDLFEYNMVQVTKDHCGRFIYDFSVIERYIELCARYGIDKEIEVFGLINIWVFDSFGYGAVAPDYPDAIRVRYFDESEGCFRFMKTGVEILQYIKALEQFFIDRKLIEKVRVVADEPADLGLYRKRLELLSETAPSFKYKTAINHAEFINEFKDRVSDFVPILPCACEEWDLVEKLKEDTKSRFLWYICCWPDIPNTFIKSPLIESRLIGLLTAYMNFDGFLRWNYTAWPERPRERISYMYPVWKAGDTNFVYPANDGRPLLSLRYKSLKRGIEDFELIRMLREKHPEADTVLEKVWKKILKTGDMKEFHPSRAKKAEELYSLDYADYLWVKTLILDEIAKVNFG